MRQNCESGRSLVASIGVFLAMAAATCIGIYWLSEIRHHLKLAETISIMRDVFQKYREKSPELLKQQNRLSGSLFLKNYRIMEECKEISSMFSSVKKVCKMPLGQLDVSISSEKSDVYTYVSVTFNDFYKRRSCVQFLNAEWESFLPKSLFGKNGYIGVVSENSTGEIYFSPNPALMTSNIVGIDQRKKHIKDVCKVCKGSRYCDIQFFFDLRETMQETTFPSEFVGENEETDDADDQEVTKDGNTYTKTSGDHKEVVTYNDNGTFSGGTFSGGFSTSSYQGTYDFHGITSYTSYTDSSKKNIINKIEGITYDKDGKVNSYKKDSRKFFLIGTADDCLIVDDMDSAKRLGRCDKLFQDEVSSVVLNYDENGLLSGIVTEGKDSSSYTFIYDKITGQLISYCDTKSGNCLKIKDGQTIKDIIKQEVPETVDKFDVIYKQMMPEPSAEPQQKPRRRFYTKAEALKASSKKGNKVRISFK